MTYNEIITLLCPTTEPKETGYLWAKFAIDQVPECQYVYYCANASIAAELLANQIKPTLSKNTGYFVVFPISDMVDIKGVNTGLNSTFSVTHFGWYDGHQSEAIARTHVTQLLAYYHIAQQRYISNIRIDNSNFSAWADDNSTLQQYTTVVTVKAVTPYALISNCYGRNI